MKPIYHYCEKSGTYLGRGVADVDPASGDPLLPAHATATPPPSISGAKFDFETGTWAPMEKVGETGVPMEATTEPLVAEVEEVKTNPVGELSTGVPGGELKAKVPTKKKRRRGKPRS